MSNTLPRAFRFRHVFLFCMCVIMAVTFGFAQEANQTQEVAQPVQSEATQEQAGAVIPESSTATPENPGVSQNVNLDFKEADIRNVLKIISYKSGMNIVSTPDVMGTVTIRLVEVPWERALDVLLKTYGYGYQQQGNVILVTKLENVAKIQAEEQLVTEVFFLKFLDATDVQKVVLPLLSSRGKMSILYSKGLKGWDFGSFLVGPDVKASERSGSLVAKAEVDRVQVTRKETVYIEKDPKAGGIISRKADFEPSVRSKLMIITDTLSSLDKIRKFVDEIDKKPRQVLVETRIMEVNRDRLKDIGFDWGTGSTGVEQVLDPITGNMITPPVTTQGIDKTKDQLRSQAGGRLLGSHITPGNFDPRAGIRTLNGISPYSAGLEILFQKLTGTQLEVIVHALEEDINTNILSAPSILTLDNQEAGILVGYQTPILKSEVSGGSATELPKLVQSLWYYQPIGISVNVVPQICKENYINMIIHPRVTASSSSITANSFSGNIEAPIAYPIIEVREAQTQILMKNAETIVIGGLLSDKKSKGALGIPFLSKIPFLGNLFKRDTVDNRKIDLLIFITAYIVDEEGMNPVEVSKLEKEIGQETRVIFTSKRKPEK